MHTVGPGIWGENWKSRKMKNMHFRTWNLARKTEKGGKFSNVYCRTWNMARKLKILENEKHPLDDLKNDEVTEKREKWETHSVGPGISRKLKITENEKHPLEDLKNDEVTEKHEKWEMHSVGPRTWWENWKSRKMRNTNFRTWNMASKTLKGGKFRNVHCETWNMARKLKIM